MRDWQPGNCVVIQEKSWTWAELLADFTQRVPLRDFDAMDQPLAWVASDARDAYGAVAAMVERRLDAVVLGPERLSPEVRAGLEAGGFVTVRLPDGPVVSPGSRRKAVPGRVSLLTSGSTGTPKIVAHRWETLYTARRVRNIRSHRWLVPYQAGTYAWYQMIAPALFQPGQSLVVPSSSDPESVVCEAVRQRVDSISATPTFWRIALVRVPETLLRSLSLSTVTLGGEAVDQAILDRLSHLFPAAQLTHIYASTEAGTCVVVKDRRAGFPVEWLSRNRPGLPALRVADGRLWVRSPFSARAATGKPAAWIDSGDLVAVRGDRVHFAGRSNAALINVGGNKAYPADVEAVLLEHPGVRWCRVRAVRAPLVGHLAAADFVANPGVEGPCEEELTRFCAERLPDYAVPRFWNRLTEIPMGPSLKSAR